MNNSAQKLNSINNIFSTRDIVIQTYGFDVTILYEKHKKNIIQILNVDHKDLFDIFEEVKNEYSEHDIYQYLMNGPNPRFTLSNSPLNKIINKMGGNQNLQQILDNKENSINAVEFNQKLLVQFHLYCLTTLKDSQKRKNILDYYNNFWEYLFLNIPTLTVEDDKKNELIDVSSTTIDIEINNMFGIEDDFMNHSYYLLKPYTFNFLHINIKNIRDQIKSVMKSQYDLDPTKYTINLRTYCNEPSDIINKIVFHNLNQTEKNDKTLNVVWNEEKLKQLEDDIKGGKEFYLSVNKNYKKYSHYKKISLREAYRKVNEEKDNSLTTYERIINKYHTGFGFKSENNVEDYDSVILIDGEKRRILYPITFYISFDIYVNDSRYKPIHELAINKLSDKSFLSDYIAGKLKFDCLIAFDFDYMKDTRLLANLYNTIIHANF